MEVIDKTMDKVEKEENKIKKIKVDKINIIVSGTADKPYYQILYREVEKEEEKVGFGSYYIHIVFKWFEKYFEIIPEVKYYLLKAEGVIELEELKDYKLGTLVGCWDKGKSRIIKETKSFDKFKKWMFNKKNAYVLKDGKINIVEYLGLKVSKPNVCNAFGFKYDYSFPDSIVSSNLIWKFGKNSSPYDNTEMFNLHQLYVELKGVKET